MGGCSGDATQLHPRFRAASHGQECAGSLEARGDRVSPRKEALGLGERLFVRAARLGVSARVAQDLGAEQQPAPLRPRAIQERLERAQRVLVLTQPAEGLDARRDEHHRASELYGCACVKGGRVPLPPEGPQHAALTQRDRDRRPNGHRFLVVEERVAEPPRILTHASARHPGFEGAPLDHGVQLRLGFAQPTPKPPDLGREQRRRRIVLSERARQREVHCCLLRPSFSQPEIGAGLQELHVRRRGQEELGHLFDLLVRRVVRESRSSHETDRRDDWRKGPSGHRGSSPVSPQHTHLTLPVAGHDERRSAWYSRRITSMVTKSCVRSRSSRFKRAGRLMNIVRTIT